MVLMNLITNSEALESKSHLLNDAVSSWKDLYNSSKAVLTLECEVDVVHDENDVTNLQAPMLIFPFVVFQQRGGVQLCPLLPELLYNVLKKSKTSMH